jgi:hypothetical protein
LCRTLLDDSVYSVCYISPSTAEPVEGVRVEPTAEFAQLQLGFVDQTQWRYEVIPQTQVLLWVSGEQLRAVFENVLLAEYYCHYDWQHQQVKEIRSGAFYPTRFASRQGTLIPFTPQDSVVVYRARRPRRRASRSPSRQQVFLFEVVSTG